MIYLSDNPKGFSGLSSMVSDAKTSRTVTASQDVEDGKISPSDLQEDDQIEATSDLVETEQSLISFSGQEVLEQSIEDYQEFAQPRVITDILMEGNGEPEEESELQNDDQIEESNIIETTGQNQESSSENKGLNNELKIDEDGALVEDDTVSSDKDSTLVANKVKLNNKGKNKWLLISLAIIVSLVIGFSLWMTQHINIINGSGVKSNKESSGIARDVALPNAIDGINSNSTQEGATNGEKAGIPQSGVAVGFNADVGQANIINKELPSSSIDISELNTQLVSAVKRGDDSEVKRLIKSGASPNTTSDKGIYILTDASGYGYLQVVNELINSGANVNIKDDSGITPILAASAVNRKDVASLLLSNGANVNTRDHAGRTPLMIASSYGYNDMVKILLSNGANPNIKDASGSTALMLASSSGNIETVRELLSVNANPNIFDVNGFTAIDIARAKNYQNIVSVLKSYGAKD